jgi:hypothetical protein
MCGCQVAGKSSASRTAQQVYLALALPTAQLVPQYLCLGYAAHAMLLS